MEHRYPRRVFLASMVMADVLLVGLLVALVALRPGGAFAPALAVAAGVALVWGALTLHFPSKVVLTSGGVSFHRYGRAHTFAWEDVEAVRVRRFLVRDRVLVRITPSRPWQGRYWILDGIERFEQLVRALEQQQRASRARRNPIGAAEELVGHELP